MKLVRWSPAGLTRPWMTLQHEMNRLFDDFFPSHASETGEWVPAMDVSETDDAYIVKAELPGMDPEQVDISLRGETLTLKGAKKQEKEEKTKSYHRVERSYGSFERSVILPAGVQSDKTEATFKNGVLTITLPKAEESKARTVKIKTV